MYDTYRHMDNLESASPAGVHSSGTPQWENIFSCNDSHMDILTEDVSLTRSLVSVQKLPLGPLWAL